MYLKLEYLEYNNTKILPKFWGKLGHNVQMAIKRTDTSDISFRTAKVVATSIFLFVFKY